MANFTLHGHSRNGFWKDFENALFSIYILLITLWPKIFWGVSGKNSDGIILSLGFDLLLLSSMEFLYRVSFFMSGYHILIFFCRYAHIMIQGHMIYFCCTIVKLCELKFQPSAHLSTNHSTALPSRLQSCPAIGWTMSKNNEISITKQLYNRKKSYVLGFCVSFTIINLTEMSNFRYQKKC